MNRRSAIRKLMVAGAASFLPGLAGAKPQDDSQDLIVRSEVRLVLLDVSVKDRCTGIEAEGTSPT